MSINIGRDTYTNHTLSNYFVYLYLNLFVHLIQVDKLVTNSGSEIRLTFPLLSVFRQKYIVVSM